MTDIVSNKREPTGLYYGFRTKLMVFMALTNCFRKNFMDFLRFVFISYDFCSSMTSAPQSMIELFFRRYKRT